jgi:transposase
MGRELLAAGGPAPPDCLSLMDGAYEGDETLCLARQLGYTPMVPPNPNRLNPWNLDRVAYRRRNEIERRFRRLKGDRRVFCRFDKLDVLFTRFILLALIAEASRFSVNRP